MVRLGWRWMVLAATFCGPGCGPDAASTTQDESGDEDTGNGPSSSADDDVTDDDDDDTSPTSIDTGVVDTTGDTEDPPLDELCWSSTLARASGVSDAWSDGERVIATGGSLVLFDGETWTETLLDREVTGVAALAHDDAWLIAGDAVLHWDGSATEVAYEYEEVIVTGLEVGPDGTPWMVTEPLNECAPIGPCEEQPSDIRTLVGDQWLYVDPPGFIVTALAFIGDVPWIGGTDGQVAFRIGTGPWELVETPGFSGVHGLWVDGEVLYVGTGSELWRYADDTWTQEVTGDFFDGPEDVVPGMDGELWLLYRRHVAGELDDTGELQRRTETGWETVATLPADRELVTLADGDLVALGDEHGQLVQTIAEPLGTPAIDTALSRPDLGDTHALAVAGDGTFIGVESHAVQIEGDPLWTRAHTNSIYGSFRAAWGATGDDVWLVNDQEDDPQPPLWHYDGAELEPAPFVDAPDGDFRLLDIWGDAPDRIWVAGAFVPDLAFDTTEPVIYRYDGAEWISVPPPEASNQEFYTRDIEVYQDQLWFAGDGVWRQDGDAWTDLTPDVGTLFVSLRVGGPGAWVLTLVDDQIRVLHLVDDAWVDETDSIPGYVSMRNDPYGPTIAMDEVHVWVAWRSSGLARWSADSWTAIEPPEEWRAVNAMVAGQGRIAVHAGAQLWTGGQCPT